MFQQDLAGAVGSTTLSSIAKSWPSHISSLPENVTSLRSPAGGALRPPGHRVPAESGDNTATVGRFQSLE